MRAFLGRLWSARRAIAAYGVLVVLGTLVGDRLMEMAIPEMRPMNEPLIHRIVMLSLAVFILTAAIPFVPGAEIGFGLLLLFGGQAAPMVYAGMVGALLVAYCVARLVPMASLSRVFGWLGLRRVAGLIDLMAKTPEPARLELLAGKTNSAIGKLALRNRYVLLGLLLNTPGNSVLGGGGGLAFFAGASGLYRFWPFLLCVTLAVAPIPLFFLLVKA